MTVLYTWGGTHFGHRDRDRLRTRDGRDIGHFQGNEIYGHNGRYLGELMNGRLITCRTKALRRSGLSTAYPRTMPSARHVPFAAYAMLAGYQDFPDPRDL